jgi:hypothetical protein
MEVGEFGVVLACCEENMAVSHGHDVEEGEDVGRREDEVALRREQLWVGIGWNRCVWAGWVCCADGAECAGFGVSRIRSGRHCVCAKLSGTRYGDVF